MLLFMSLKCIFNVIFFVIENKTAFTEVNIVINGGGK